MGETFRRLISFFFLIAVSFYTAQIQQQQNVLLVLSIENI